MTQWPFDQPKNAVAITTKEVMNKSSDILRVTHDLDDHGWQFLGKNGADIEQAMVVSMENVVSLDTSVLEIAEIQPGQSATRKSKNDDWVIEKT